MDRAGGTNCAESAVMLCSRDVNHNQLSLVLRPTRVWKRVRMWPRHVSDTRTHGAGTGPVSSQYTCSRQQTGLLRRLNFTIG